MSFNDKEFWITKDGHLSDHEAAVFDSSSRIEAKRAHQWFSDAAAPELFPNKRQAVHTSLNGSTSEIAMASSAPWETSSGLYSGENQFIDRLFGVDTTKPVYRKVNDNQIRDDPSVGNINMSISQVYNSASESEPYNSGAISSRSIEPSVEKDHSTTSIADSFTRGDSDAIFGYELAADIDVLARPISSFGYLHYQSSVQKSETHCENQLDASNANTVDMSGQTLKPTTTRNKSDSKPARKEAPNSFPSNVRSLIATGLLEGVPVKYVLSRQEVRGFIKGSGYLCGCEPCNYSKVVNAYEFERHAGCKTKHPNNHIYFENGKTIYQIVQELKSTPESLLFDTIQTVTGSPINQKAFQIWKESFQAATRELQRIYGKEELNL